MDLINRDVTGTTSFLIRWKATRLLFSSAWVFVSLIGISRSPLVTVMIIFFRVVRNYLWPTLLSLSET